ncbi:hypothetical protein KW838_29250, partial [Pseudomonas sp. PDM27]|nr:hypothetical protein [Pseudomonas sp. PDM27]
AMDVNDNAFCLNKRVALAFIASKLAPTGIPVVVEGLDQALRWRKLRSIRAMQITCRSELARDGRKR